MVGKQHGLGRLDMRHAGQDRLAVAQRQPNERTLHLHDRPVQVVQSPAQPQPHVRRNLVVARPARVQSAGHRPNALPERDLQVHVDVLEGRIPGQLAGLDLRPQAFEPAHQRLDLFGRQQFSTTQSVDVGNRAGNVIDGQGVVEINRARELRHPHVRHALEPTAPHPHRISSAPRRRMRVGPDATTLTAGMVPAR